MSKQVLKGKFYVEIRYNDGSEFGFDVIIEGSESAIVANLMMITRGTLMASSGCYAVCYRDDGFEVCAYSR